MKTNGFININYKKVGIMVSGGLDSALLLYLISKENKEQNNIYAIDALTVYRPDDAKNHSSRIIKLVEKLLGVTITHLEVGNPNVDPDNQVISGINDALFVRKYDNIFLATTAIPQHLINCFDVPTRDTNSYPKLTQPWGSITKDQIVQYIIDHQLYELIEVSHSCTGLQHGHCGYCFNCKERQWAFEQNNFKDSTKY
jgi:7-cyano-7-deazaguanine synthase in queuosine biosynthesis